jgi:hypothetical protein
LSVSLSLEESSTGANFVQQKRGLQSVSGQPSARL